MTVSAVLELLQSPARDVLLICDRRYRYGEAEVWRCHCRGLYRLDCDGYSWNLIVGWWSDHAAYVVASYHDMQRSCKMKIVHSCHH